MSRINQLDSVTANKIKAGEVIERPVSVVKELFDNSIDAGASEIKIEFKNGGITLIRVTDNGIGMDSEDARKAFPENAGRGAAQGRGSGRQGPPPCPSHPRRSTR